MNIELALAWIEERESIRLKRAAGAPYPWTTDPILGTYSFCNVRREDDRVTRWIDENIRQPFADHPALWWMICAARQINWPDTLQELISTPGAWPSYKRFHPAAVTEVLDGRKRRGEKIYTGAYMIRAESHKAAPHFAWTKQRYIAEIVLGRLWDDRIRFKFDPTSMLEGTHTLLMEYTGWGPFMSYQAVVDMRFTPLLRRAPDRDSWAAAGPGTIRGLNRIAGRAPKARLTQSEALLELRELCDALRRRTRVEFDFSDVPNICCEMDKFLRVQAGEGRPRSLYIPNRRAS